MDAFDQTMPKYSEGSIKTLNSVIFRTINSFLFLQLIFLIFFSQNIFFCLLAINDVNETQVTEECCTFQEKWIKGYFCWSKRQRNSVELETISSTWIKLPLFSGSFHILTETMWCMAFNHSQSPRTYKPRGISIKSSICEKEKKKKKKTIPPEGAILLYTH